MERTWVKRTDELIKKALAEDLGNKDITTKAIVPSKLVSTAYLFNKTYGVIAGIDVAKKVFHKINPKLEFKAYCKDGDILNTGQKVAEITGPVASILKGERTALNFLGRMSGIATKTARCVKQIDGCHAKVLDTRKTIPTMRHLDKYSVRVGGGSNHRFGLFDMVLIKDNHIAIAGGIRIAVEKALSYLKNNEDMKIEIECKSYDDVLEAVHTKVDIIMLDNMDISEIEKSINTIREASHGNERAIRIEVSGNIDEDNIRAIADTGVDYISIGALTHSVVNHDFTLLFDEL
ncbi:MAG TPA: carboxylating nicotinate-nucleotide diphosphorylase [bacterium]|nr:carboxylating nicotinate-nucleotide diphosphorylase [bacterium]